MNMNSMTTLVTLLVIGIGYISPFFADQIRSVGFFALSGAVTNWLAIHMLFERVPGLYGSGVIPLHFEDFKGGIKILIMDQFFTKENVSRLMESETGVLTDKVDFSAAADAVNYDRIFEGLSETILASSLGGMLGMFGGASVIEGFRAPFIEKTKEIILSETSSPEFHSMLAGSMDTEKAASDIIENVSSIVQKRLDELTPVMVKEIVKDMIKKHLGWLVLWGGVFGGIIGLAMSLLPI
ncbi:MULTISPECIES: DUF445 domain-containing protein [unclassified Oceanispirochaeta]|uniref:DUF445 domain-containing protein n=1 Tax=unclassified Oceanispirochaeta TaxID=2635722 RepID=UPI000E09D42E|nr:MULTISPECIES: DUF445 domain-containing protein [unclassified Oceanispirochaeta]MBF9017031.1 DUF445 domain-containing protein [Oceanispirochaeta sp. M2]NPD73480.1 DUF445 domain-containing protein [Oceanispirochaeta sp. M1]RDG30771.1 DUF445 domain-containing protein [Oceanispirochaeta sp. M1]